MSQLKREHWEKLYKKDIAFADWPEDLFEFLLDKVFGSSSKGNPAKSETSDVDEDTLMVYLVRKEPPVGPGCK